MASDYRRAHLTVAPFTDMSRCKAMPNSLLESLACGVPVVLTDVVGLAEFVLNEKCGLLTTTATDGLCGAIERVLADRCQFATTARKAAERWFSAKGFIENYRRIYAQVL
jgi:glycosyltransferase involved in cell wall biosynthesis